MKKKNIFNHFQLTTSILICISLFFFASVLEGQTGISKDQTSSLKNKVSDNPHLRLPIDKQNWPPITPPDSKKRSPGISSKDPRITVEYDLQTQTVRQFDYQEIFNASLPPDFSQDVSEFIGISGENEQIEQVFPPDERIKISPTVDFPWRTICKLYITFPDGNHFVGTGVAIGRNDGIGFHCLTAGHNVYRTEYGGWAQTIEIIPALDNDYTPFYSAWAIKIKTNLGWTLDSLEEYDWACLTLDRQIGNFTGWMDRFTTTDLNWYKERILHGAGYPNDRDFGLCQYYDSDSCKQANEYFLWYDMDISEGQSGMPIWIVDGNTRRIVAIHNGYDDSLGYNRGIRLNAEKYYQLNQWLNEDSSPTDRADLIDDGPKWSSFQPDVAVRGFTEFKVWNDVRNIGTAYSGPVTIAYFASIDSDIDAEEDSLIGKKQIKSIPSFTWRDAEWEGVFPEEIPAGEYYVGWIIDPENRVVEFDETNNTAFVSSKKLLVKDPYIEILSPNGGETFAIGEENTVDWFTAGGSGLITIDASFDSGASWQNLITNISDNGSYQWNIPQTQQPVFNCLIKITDTSKDLADSSDATFIIETRPTVPGAPLDSGDFSNQEDITFSWSGSEDPETGISGYQVQVGTSPDTNDVADAVIGNELFFQVKAAHNQKIYARVRSHNGVGLFSHWSTSSDGILVDLTPPPVMDKPVDQGDFTSVDSVLFQWLAAKDEESGIIDYRLQVGSTTDSADIVDEWVGNIQKYTVAGSQSQTLYARIRAKNSAGSESEWSAWSDGITIDMTPPGAPGKPYSEAQFVNYFDIPFFWDAATEDVGEIAKYQLRVIDIHADSQVVFEGWVENALEYLVAAEDGQALLASVRAQNKAGLIGPWATADSPVMVQLTPALLKLIEGSRAFKDEGWDNAIDNDIQGWNGTVSAFTTYPPYPYAIFGFIGGGTGRIEKIKLLTDTKVGFKNRWVTHFRVLYSITGIADGDFISLVDGEKLTGGWEEFAFPEQTVKFIKLIVDQPTSATTQWCQVGEFQVFGRAEYVKTEQADLNITYGTPTDPAENWPRAIDGNINGWEGTVTAMTLDPPAYVIFNFADNSIKNVTKIRLLTDTGVRFPFRWLTEFHIEVSTTGTKNSDFSTVFSASKNVGDWESFYFDPVPAKYVKLVLDRPDPGESDYCQIGEVEIYTQSDTVLTPGNDSTIPLHKSEPLAVVEMPNSYHVEQNYPNPFNPETTIRFQLPENTKVMVKIYNMIGQEITTLIEGILPAGHHSVIWNGRDLQGNKVPSGVYLYQFRAGDYNATRKMVLLE